MVKSSEMGNLLQKDQLFILSGLALITVLAWAYMFRMAWEMVGKGMDINLACLGHWGPGDLAHMFIYYVVDYDGGHDDSFRHPHDHHFCNGQSATE
jgi:predicted metal-binding membrane protein